VREIFQSSWGLPIKIFLIFIGVGTFFFAYNKFLIDDSLRGLEVSLSRVNEGQIIGVKDILQQVVVEAALADDVKDLSQLEYVNNILDKTPEVAEASVFLSSVIRGKKIKRGAVFNALDKVALALKGFTDAALSIGRRKSTEELEESFKEAKKLYDLKDFVSAKKIFKEIVRSGQGTSYSDLASIYVQNIQTYMDKEKEIAALLDEIKDLSEPEQRQKAYYDVAMLYVQANQYDKAEIYFNKALGSKESELVQKAYFGLGFSKKIQGKIDEAKDIFDSLVEQSKDSQVYLKAKTQIADILNEQDKPLEAAEVYNSLVKDEGDSPLGSIFLFLESTTHALGTGKIEEADKLLAKLIIDYPASTIIEEAKLILEQRNIDLFEEELSLRDRITLSAFKNIPPLRLILKVAKAGATYFALYMIEGSIKQALLQNKNEGDVIMIERTDEFLTNWVRERLELVPESIGNFEVKLTNFRIRFPRNGWVEITGIVEIGDKQLEAYVSGEMFLKKIIDPPMMWEEELSPQVWVVYEIREAKIGNYNIPLVLANEMLDDGEATFNKKQIFEQERLLITPRMGVWAGKVKYDRRTLEERLEEIERHKKGLLGMED